MGLDAGLSSLDFFVVNFERFCGHVAEGEGPESSGEEELAAKRREKTQKRSGVWRVIGGGGKKPLFP